jgi:Fic family protein
LNPRQHKALAAIFAQGPDRVAQGLSAKTYRKITGAASATATRDLAALEGAGVLQRSQAGGRSTQYEVLY